MSTDGLMDGFWKSARAIVMPNGDRVSEIYADHVGPAAPRLVMVVWSINDGPVGLGLPALTSWRALGEHRDDGYYYDEIEAPTPGILARYDLVWRAPEA